MKIAYCGYDFFYTCLSTLVAGGHEILKVFSWETDGEYDFNAEVLRIARAAGAPVSMAPIQIADLQELHSLGCELLVTAAYPYRVPPHDPFIPFGINIHPSPLPIGRGPWPLPWIILQGLRSSAVTFHKLAPRMDAGDILLATVFDVSPTENLETLSVKTQMAAEASISNVVENLGALYLKSKPQEKGSYWKMPNDEQRTLDFSGSIVDIDRVARAFGKFDSNAWVDGVLYWVQDVTVWIQQHSYPPGSLVHRTNREFVIAARDGLVCMRQFKIVPTRTP